MSTKTLMAGKEVEEVVTYENYKEFCDGIKWGTRFERTMGGKLIDTVEFLDMKCVPVDKKLFEKPEQVADGTIEEKQTAATTVACTKMKGPYTKTGDTIGKLVGFMTKQKLAPAGAPMTIYLKAVESGIVLHKRN